MSYTGKTPVNFPSVLSGIVSLVDDTLYADIGAHVYFRHGTWQQIMDSLVKDGTSPVRKAMRYPMVALIHDHDVTVKSSEYGNIKCDILICCLSTPSESTTKRMTDSYEAILYPIYAELMNEIGINRFVMNGYRKIEHKRRDAMNMGGESGRKAYALPDYLDGLFILDMDLKMDMDKCSMSMPSPCELEPCTNGKELALLDYISQVNMSGYGSSTLSVELVSVVLDDPGSLVPVPTYSVAWGDTTSESIAVGDTKTHDVSGLDDGWYKVSVFRDGGSSQIEMIYRVVNGELTEGNLVGYISVGSDLSCLHYPDYPITISALRTSTSPVLTGSSVDVFGVGSPQTDSFTATDTFDGDIDIESDLSATDYRIRVAWDHGIGTEPTDIIYFKTDCQ